jgi:flagellar hook protein FlgE
MPLTSFYTALTGINNNSTAINIIGDNLANMGTTAFKSSKANFSELLAGLSGSSPTGDPISFGKGSMLNGVSRNMSQGTVINTGQSTDAAINGNGFFVVSAGSGLGYTRSGKFQFDKDGNFLTADGLKLMGYPGVGGQINTNSAPASIVIKKGQTIPAVATTNMTISANLDASAPIATTPPVLGNGSTFATSVQVVDSLGTPHNVTVTFSKTAAGAWNWVAEIPAVDTGGLATAAPVQVGTGSISFDTSGNMVVANPVPAAPTLNITGLANGAGNMTINFNLWDPTGVGNITGSDTDGSSVSTTTQDGMGASILKDINITSDGVIMGVSEGGRSIPLAQLALADFPNLQGLQKFQGSTYISSPSSGEPSIGVAGKGGRGAVVGSSLEQSNVDMAQEFVNLIVAQRAYQANSRIITTTDELYQDSINLKR